MTTQEILDQLRLNGVEVSVAGGNLQLKAKGAPLSNELRTLVKENKAALIESISQKIGSDKKETREKTHCTHKEYTYPNGEKIQLSRDEFMSVVEVFTMLLDQETKLILQGKQLNKTLTSGEMFEPDRTTLQTK